MYNYRTTWQLCLGITNWSSTVLVYLYIRRLIIHPPFPLPPPPPPRALVCHSRIIITVRNRLLLFDRSNKKNRSPSFAWMKSTVRYCPRAYFLQHILHPHGHFRCVIKTNHSLALSMIKCNYKVWVISRILYVQIYSRPTSEQQLLEGITRD